MVISNTNKTNGYGIEAQHRESQDFNQYKNVRVQEEGGRMVSRTVDDAALTIDMAKGERSMNELQVFNFNQVDVVDSRDVAKMVEREHNELMKSIRTYAKYLNEGEIAQVDFFIESTYKAGNGQEQPCYLITKKGCDMIANKMTGQKGVLFTAAYVTAFEKMREQTQMILPKDYPSALRALADAEEKKLRKGESL